MSVFTNCLNKFFKDNENIDNISGKQIIKLGNKYDIGTHNILGIIQGNRFNWSWSIPTFKRQDIVNEGIAYKYLEHGLSIFKDKNQSELNNYNLYLRYILTKSQIELNSEYEVVWLLSILNNVKNKDNIILINKINIEGNLKKKNWEKNMKQIKYNEIDLNDKKHYYKIYEIPKKYLD